MMPVLPWPPPYTLVKNPRSRSVRLKLCPVKGLLLVVPMRFAARDALGVINQHRAWIEKTWRKVCAHQAVKIPLQELTQLRLTAIDEVWQVEHISALRTKVLTHQHHHLVIHSVSETLSQKALQQWLQAHAEMRLLPWLRKLSEQLGLPFGLAKIRTASSRWGSCNSKKTIMLNAKLLFLPKDVVEYVMIHELCHTIHMNHGPHFWALLTQHNPLCQLHRRQLKHIHSLIPTALY